MDNSKYPMIFGQGERLGYYAYVLDWNEGKNFIMVSCKLRPEFGINVNSASWKQLKDFDKLINEFSYYNCGDSERGRYPAFYVEL